MRRDRRAEPQSARQQELVCLKAAHADCPRYLRGAMALPEPPRPRRQAAVPRATLAALLILVLSAGISFGFVVQRGGIELPVVAAARGSSAVAVVATPAARAARGHGRPEASGRRRPSPGDASPSRHRRPRPTLADPARPPSPTPSPHAVADAEPHARADAEADEEAHQRPLRAPRAVPRPQQLLDLHGPLGRQPVQHRELLRALARDDLPAGTRSTRSTRLRVGAEIRMPPTHALIRRGQPDRRSRPAAATGGTAPARKRPTIREAPWAEIISSTTASAKPPRCRRAVATTGVVRPRPRTTDAPRPPPVLRRRRRAHASRSRSSPR